jgi:hypothetical protein
VAGGKTKSLELSLDDMASITLRRAAELLDTDTKTLRKHIAEGMPATGTARAPRVDLVAVAAWMNKQLVISNR